MLLREEDWSGPVGDGEGEKSSLSCQNLNQGLVVR